MRPPVKLAAFAAVLIATFGLGLGLGQVAGPFDPPGTPPVMPPVIHGGHGAEGGE